MYSKQFSQYALRHTHRGVYTLRAAPAATRAPRYPRLPAGRCALVGSIRTSVAGGAAPVTRETVACVVRRGCCPAPLRTPGARHTSKALKAAFYISCVTNIGVMCHVHAHTTCTCACACNLYSPCVRSASSSASKLLAMSSEPKRYEPATSTLAPAAAAARAVSALMPPSSMMCSRRG